MTVRPPGSVQGGAHRRDLQMMAGSIERLYSDPLGNPSPGWLWNMHEPLAATTAATVIQGGTVLVSRLKHHTCYFEARSYFYARGADGVKVALYEIIKERDGRLSLSMVKDSRADIPASGVYNLGHAIALHEHRRYAVAVQFPNFMTDVYGAATFSSLPALMGTFYVAAGNDGVLPDIVKADEISPGNDIPLFGVSSMASTNGTTPPLEVY